MTGEMGEIRRTGRRPALDPPRPTVLSATRPAETTRSENDPVRLVATPIIGAGAPAVGPCRGSAPAVGSPFQCPFLIDGGPFLAQGTGQWDPLVLVAVGCLVTFDPTEACGRWGGVDVVVGYRTAGAGQLPLPPCSGRVSVMAPEGCGERVGRAVADHVGDFSPGSARRCVGSRGPASFAKSVRYCIGAWPSASRKVRANAARGSPLISASSGTDHACPTPSCMACSAAFSRGSADARYQRGAVVL